jgi:hypothetical protein
MVLSVLYYLTRLYSLLIMKNNKATNEITEDSIAVNAAKKMTE